MIYGMDGQMEHSTTVDKLQTAVSALDQKRLTWGLQPPTKQNSNGQGFQKAKGTNQTNKMSFYKSVNNFIMDLPTHTFVSTQYLSWKKSWINYTHLQQD